MGLAAGTRIGSYEIIGSLGAGGMGEVYRARDTRLKRDVALKILPESFATDPERLARFQREAEVLGSINHPLIAHIYGIEEGGADAGGAARCRAIVMELVEGEDLAQRLARGPIAIDDAIPIARQIAEALDAAHEQGIVHRDLKPANIKVRPDGTVKVLDFGLAKALDGAGSAGSTASASAGLLNSPTITTPAMTLQGMILGTAAYMSPEQAKGRPADRRSDLWAFGCVLYEMLTGKRPFDGEDVSDTLALVLKGSPDWSALPADTPPAIRTLIQRCLERDRRHRVASASTALYALSDSVLVAEGTHGAVASSTQDLRTSIQSAVADERRRMLRRVVAPIAALAVSVVAAALIYWIAKPQEPPTSARLIVAIPGGEGLPSGRRIVAISPDGNHLAYVSNFRLYVRSLSEYEFRELLRDSVSSGMNLPVFSPDSSSLATYGSGTIRRLSLAGGAAVTLCDVAPPYGMSWDDSGLLVGQGAKGIVRCPATGGRAEPVVAANDGEELHGPQLLPGGRTILYTVAQAAEGRGRWDTAQIVAQPVNGGERRVLVNGGSDGRYLPSGHLVYALAGVILAAPFDLDRLELSGPAVPVIEGVTRTLTGLTGTAQYDVASNGTLIYLPGPARASRERAIAVASRDGVVTRLNVPLGPYEHVRASPDGTRLAIGSDDGKEAIVWIHAFASGASLQRLSVSGRNASPIWSPDGQSLAVQSNREQDLAIFRLRVDGTGVERLTRPAAGEIHTPESWSPDGRTIAFSVEKDGRFSLQQLTVATKRAEPLGDVESGEPTNAVFSPDGKWIAYTKGQPGGVQSPNRGVYVQPFPPTGAIYQLPQRGLDFHPVWTRQGREIVWVPSAASSQHAAVSISTTAGLTFGAAQTFPARITARQTSSQRRLYDVLPDGSFVGAVDPTDPGTATAGSFAEIRIVLNWVAELKQKAPVR